MYGTSAGRHRIGVPDGDQKPMTLDKENDGIVTAMMVVVVVMVVRVTYQPALSERIGGNSRSHPYLDFNHNDNFPCSRRVTLLQPLLCSVLLLECGS